MTDSVLSPQALANTYSPQGFESGWEAVDQYLLVVEYADRNPEATWTDAATTFGLPPNRVKRWYNGRKQTVVRQIETADALGWFDASWNSEIGRAFNLIIAGILSGGTLSQSFEVRITIDDDLDDATRNSIETAFEVLCGKTKLVSENDPQRATMIEPAEHNLLLGRALYVLGVPKGRKTEAEFTIPEHLSNHPECQREFVELYVALRGSVSEKGTIDIREERSQTYLQSLAVLIETVTGESAKVRENGVFLRKATAEALSGSVEWDVKK
ncbi:hypothetical protein C2R22_21365 (plasmid) [Salinigranum rubrum]|uniref:Uncharacterized protein n=1 Tax=Salinigranum rubrum TaxID=755307 RepID=A0A2I8VQD1_9EURY|nr:hypothetical protein [Salinigranum rubrum]AUV84133.1 hypothetical protein C2R22_21365 [Salinigranum rubrum]